MKPPKGWFAGKGEDGLVYWWGPDGELYSPETGYLQGYAFPVSIPKLYEFIGQKMETTLPSTYTQDLGNGKTVTGYYDADGDWHSYGTSEPPAGSQPRYPSISINQTPGISDLYGAQAAAAAANAATNAANAATNQIKASTDAQSKGTGGVQDRHYFNQVQAQLVKQWKDTYGVMPKTYYDEDGYLQIDTSNMPEETKANLAAQRAQAYQTGVALGIIDGTPTLAAKIAEGESKRADTKTALGRQDQSFSQEMTRREFDLKLASNPESWLSSVANSTYGNRAGVPAPIGSGITRTPDVEDYLKQSGAGAAQLEGYNAATSPSLGGGAPAQNQAVTTPETMPTTQPVPVAHGSTPLYDAGYLTANPNVQQQAVEWQNERTNLGQDPNDSEAFRQHLIAIGATDPGPTTAGMPQKYQSQSVKPSELNTGVPKPVSGPPNLAPANPGGGQPAGMPTTALNVGQSTDTRQDPMLNGTKPEVLQTTGPSRLGTEVQRQPNVMSTGPSAKNSMPLDPTKINSVGALKANIYTPDQLKAAITPIGAPGAWNGTGISPYAMKPRGGLRPASLQTVNAMNPDVQQAYQGLKVNTGNKYLKTPRT